MDKLKKYIVQIWRDRKYQDVEVYARDPDNAKVLVMVREHMLASDVSVRGVVEC